MSIETLHIGSFYACKPATMHVKDTKDLPKGVILFVYSHQHFSYIVSKEINLILKNYFVYELRLKQKK